MDLNKLKKLQQQFTEELSRLNEQAKTEDEYNELESIALDVVCKIPITILQTDYYSRSDVRYYIEDLDKYKGKNITPELDKVMNKLRNSNIITFCREDINSQIAEEV